MSQRRSVVDRGINTLLLVATEMAKPREDISGRARGCQCVFVQVGGECFVKELV